MTATERRRRWQLDPVAHPVWAAVVGGALFAVLTFIVTGLISSDWSARSLISCTAGGLIFWGPLMTLLARRKLRRDTGEPQ